MSLQRNVNPLPAGHYWVDLDASTAIDFRHWADVNAKVESTETDADSGREFFVFHTDKPTEGWDATRFGFPEIVREGQTVTSIDDVIQKPESEDTVARVERLVGFVALGVGVVWGGYLLWKVTRPKEND